MDAIDALYRDVLCAYDADRSLVPCMLALLSSLRYFCKLACFLDFLFGPGRPAVTHDCSDQHLSISVGEYSVADVFPVLIHIGELFSILYAASPTIPMSFRMVRTLDSQEPGPVINCTEQIPRFSIREHTSTDPRIAFPKPHNCIPCKWEYWCLYCNSALSYLHVYFLSLEDLE